MDTLIPGTIRSSDRVDDNTRQVPSLNDVRLTMVLMELANVKVTPTKDFFDMCREWQRNIEAACAPRAVRNSAVGGTAMISRFNASKLPRGGFIVDAILPINLGRFNFPVQHTHVQLDSIHFGQSYSPFISVLCGFLWPCETDGRVTWSMQHWPSLSTDAQAQAQLDLWDKTLAQAEQGLLTTPQDFFSQLKQTGELSTLLVALDKPTKQ